MTTEVSFLSASPGSSPLYVEDVESDVMTVNGNTCEDDSPSSSVGRTMRDLQLQRAWAAFCQSSSLSTNEKGEYLNHFLCLLLETTPNHIPAINCLNFSKHQVISSYIGSHFLVELENLCGNTSLLSGIKSTSSDHDPPLLSPLLPLSDLERNSVPSSIPTLKEHPKHLFTWSAASSSSSPSPSLAGEERFPFTEMGSEELETIPSETSLRVHHSEESASSPSLLTRDMPSSFRSDLRKRPTKKDTLHFIDKRPDLVFLSELDPTAGSSDRGSEKAGVDEKCGVEHDVSLDHELIREHPCSTPSPSFSSTHKDCASQGKTSHPEEDLMASIKEFLTRGRGARMLMVLDQIGAVGTTVGYEVVKFLGYIFECLLDEVIAAEETVSNLEKNGTCLSSSIKCSYQPMMAEIKLRDIFKPILHPRNPSVAHPTGRVEAHLSRNVPIKRVSLTGGSSVAGVRRHTKRFRRRRESLLGPENKADSEEEGERMRKQYIQYKKTLQTCECFHPSSLLKRRTDSDEAVEWEKRPTCLHISQLFDVILSVIVQFSLYDPFSNSVDHNSNKCARHVMGFSFKILDKLSEGLTNPIKSPDRIALLQRFSDPLIKIVFSGCQKFLKNASLFKALAKFNVPEQLYQFAKVLLSLIQQSDSSSKNPAQPWLVNTLENIAVGVAFVMKALCCEIEEVTFAQKDSFSMRKFFRENCLSTLEEIFSLSLRVKSDQTVDIVQAFGKLILYLKVWKEDCLHNSHCEKSSHKYCEYSSFSSHHFNYYGETINTSTEGTSYREECLVSQLVQLLLHFFRRCRDPGVSQQTLHLLSRSGFCCCMKLSLVIPHLLDDLESRTEKVQNAIATFIEVLVWSEFGGSGNTNEKNDCHYCTDASAAGPIKRTDRWSGLSEYSNYVFSPSVGPLITYHLARLVQISNPGLICQIIEKFLWEKLKTLIADNYKVVTCDSATSATIAKNLLKCLRVSYSRTRHPLLQELLKESGLTLIQNCKKNHYTRLEALHLLCSVIDTEQRWANERRSKAFQEATLFGVEFSLYYLSEIESHASFWARHFHESSLHVRRKVNVKEAPLLTPSRTWSDESEMIVEALEGDDSVIETNEAGERDALVYPNDFVKSNLERETQRIHLGKKTVDYATLVEMYWNAADLWHLTSEIARESRDFLAFVVKSSVCDVVAPFLISLIQDYARASNDLLEEPSVVYKNVGTTLALCRSLLTTMILCFSIADRDLEKPLEEVRHHILRISCSNCTDIRAFISMLLHCSVLGRDRETRRPSNLSSSGNSSCGQETPSTCLIGESDQSSAAETDAGYDADTENNHLKISDTSPSASQSKMKIDDGRLRCPELLVCALDLVICHHQRYVEAKELAATRNEKTPHKSDSSPYPSSKDVVEKSQHGVKGKSQNSVDDKGGIKNASEKRQGESGNEGLLVEEEAARDGVGRNTLAISGSPKESRKGAKPSECTGWLKEGRHFPATAKLKRKRARHKRRKRKIQPEFSSTETFSAKSKMSYESFISPPSSQTTTSTRGPYLSTPEEGLGLVHEDASKDPPRNSDSKSESSLNQTNSTPGSSFVKPPLCMFLEENHISILCQTLHDIFILCRSSGAVALQLQRLNFLPKLIHGFAKLIKSNDPGHEELIPIIVNLWCEVAQHHLEAPHLAQFFDLFKAPKPPVNTLLRALCRVFDHGSGEPHSVLRFCRLESEPSPRPRTDLSLEESQLNSLNTSLTSLTSFVQVDPPISPAAEAIAALRSNQVLQGVSSCVSVSSPVCPVPRSLDWSLYNDGAAVAAWISVQRRYFDDAFIPPRLISPRDSAGYRQAGGHDVCVDKPGGVAKGTPPRCHVLSIGSPQLIFSLWVDAVSDKMYVNASSQSDKNSTVIDEMCFEKVALKNSEWHHLALVLPKISLRRGGPVKVTVFLDGLMRFEAQLRLPSLPAVKKSTPSYLFLGHTDLPLKHRVEVEVKGEPSPGDVKSDSDADTTCPCSSSSQSPFWPSHNLSLGFVFVFREPVLTVQGCLGLISLGKNASSLVVTAPEPHKTAFASLINRKLLSSKIDLSFLFKDLRTLLSPLQESLLLQYSPHASDEYIYYKKATPIHPDHSVSPYPVCVTQKAVLSTPVAVVQKKSPELALLTLGGASHLAFLVARMAELSLSEKNLADSISLVFKICHLEPNIRFQFSIFGGPNLICRLLMAPEAPAGVLVLKALLEACIEPSIIQFEASRSLFCIAPYISAYIMDRGLLENILDNWKCFTAGVNRCPEYVCLDVSGKELSCIGVILSVLTVLLRDGCPFKKFNLVQLSDIRALQRILDMFEEMKAEDLSFDYIGSPELIVNVISLLLGGKSQGDLSLSSSSSSLSAPLLDYGPVSDRRDDTSASLGLVLPDLKGADVKEVGYFLLSLHPDEFTYVATDKRNAFYLTHQTLSSGAKTKRADSSFTSMAFREGNQTLSLKFSQFSLRDVTHVDENNSSDDSPPSRSLVEKGEDVLSGSVESPLSPISPVKSPSIQAPTDDVLSDIEVAPMKGPEVIDLSQWEKVEAEVDEGPRTLDQASGSNTKDSPNVGRVRRSHSLPAPGPCGKSIARHSSADPLETDLGFGGSGKMTKKRDDEEHSPENDFACIEVLRESSDGNPSRNLPEKPTGARDGSHSPISTPPEGATSGRSTRNSTTESTENATTLPLLTVGLLNAVDGILRTLSATQAMIVISEMFTIDLVVLFANHPVASVRAAALGLFRMMLLRGRKEYCSFHLKRNIVHLMSLQLHKHFSASEALLADAFALGLRLDLKLGDVTSKNVVLSPNHKFSLFVPLFAILPNCVNDVSICHNNLTIFLHILKMNEDMLIKIYLKTHFIDSLLLTVRSALHRPPGSCGQDQEELHSGKVIIDDVTEILCYLIHQLVASEGSAPFTTCREVLCHVDLFYRRECQKCGSGAPCSLVFLDLSTALLESAFYKLRRTSLNIAHHQPHYVIVSADTNSSTNSDDEDPKSPSRLRHFEGLRRFTNFFHRSTAFVKEGFTHPRRHSKDEKSSTHSYVQNDDVDIESPTELSPAMQRMTLNNLTESYKIILQLCVHFVVVTAQRYRELRPPQERFAFLLLEVLCSSIGIIADYESSSPNRQPQGLEYLALGCTTIVENFWCLLTYLVCPEMTFSVRIAAIQLIHSEPQIRRIFEYSTKTDMTFLYRFGIFVHELRYRFKRMNDETIEKIEDISAILESCDVITLPPPEGKLEEWTVVAEEKRRWNKDKLRFIGAILQQNITQSKRYLTKPKLDLAHEQICAEGNRMSWQLLEVQNERLKAALKRIKDSQCRRIKFTYCWRDIVDFVTHEKAAWYFPEAFPSGWKLDGTEGPMRIRKRMMRCRLNIENKFFHPYYLERHNKMASPLHSLLVDTEVESALSHIVDSIGEDEKLVHTCRASFVAPTREQKGEFLISHKNLYFIGEENASTNSCVAPTVISKFWPADVLREMHLRRYRLRDCALELFSTDGQSALLAFPDEDERNKVMDILMSMHFPNILREVSLREYTAMWREGVITNFEYLTQLNKLAGRSFNDLMQYPVFPFVLQDYSSKILNLEDSSIYRNLKKPIPIQKDERKEHFKRNYEASKHMSPDGPYHYGSHYSNSGIVLYYLIRLPPFTQLFLEFQDGNFDVPDRSFHTLDTTWRLAASESTTAIRELIPEFFFLPEAFSNTQGFKFGVRQNGEMVNHVNLPPWSLGDPRRFVLVHRASLESAHVTRHLPHWIDLVFGFKQTGKAAVEAVNVFHPATYFGFDVEIDSDELAIEARRTMIRTYGQTPRQLLTYPHPSPSIGSFLHLTTVAGEKNEIPQVLSDVTGIPWGVYAGSPADSRPSVQLVQNLRTTVCSMVTVSQNEVILLSPDTIVHTVKSRKADTPFLHRYVISWRYNDGIVRCRHQKTSVVYPLISVPLYNKVTCCVVSQNHLWLGTECGQILVYLMSPLHGKGGELAANAPNHPLSAHSAAIWCLCISHDFKVCFSGGDDGAVVLWDTKRLAYIRSVTVTEARISFLAVSETLGDWVSVTHAVREDRSVLRFYTINAEFIESVQVESLVTCVAFSNAPEGRSVNVIAVGSADRAIRLFSTWDMSLVRVLLNDKVKEPPISLLYTDDNYHLCVITENHFLVVWETTQVKCKMPKFVTAGAT